MDSGTEVGEHGIRKPYTGNVGHHKYVVNHDASDANHGTGGTDHGASDADHGNKWSWSWC